MIIDVAYAIACSAGQNRMIHVGKLPLLLFNCFCWPMCQGDTDAGQMGRMMQTGYHSQSTKSGRLTRHIGEPLLFIATVHGHSVATSRAIHLHCLNQ